MSEFKSHYRLAHKENGQLVVHSTKYTDLRQAEQNRDWYNTNLPPNIPLGEEAAIVVKVNEKQED